MGRRYNPGSARPFFHGLAAFYLLNVGRNWWYYTRKNAEEPC